MRTRVFLIGMVSALSIGCAGNKSAQDNQAVADTPAASPAAPAQAPARTGGRNAAWGPTADDGFRDPFGFNGESIFDELDWPAPNQYRAGSGAPGHAYWQQQVDYVIDATLDAEANSIEATATVTYHNNSPDSLDYVWLHLEQNLFRPDAIGALANEPESRFGYRGETEGGYKIRSLTSGGNALSMQTYDTMGRIDLDAPIKPGETWSFDISWTFNIPEFGADRMAMQHNEQGTTYEIAQWIPTVANYDDVHGWNTLPYLGQGEFYTNFGDYTVRITAPRDHVVVASGLLQNPGDVLTAKARQRLEEAWKSEETVFVREATEVGNPESWPAGDGPLTWVFKSEQMRTFAWASSAGFIWDAASIANSGGAHAVDGRTLIQAVYPKEAIDGWSDAVEMAQHAVAFNSEMWYPFPYASATNVHGSVGGMEYPGIVFCGARRGGRGLYGVTDHEFGHNWFPMLVNTDERRYPWMDEGFNTFINMYTAPDYYDQDPPDGSQRSNRRRRGGGTMSNQQPIYTYPDRMWRGRLGYLAYAKPGAGLLLLREGILGHERFDAAFKTYIQRWAFKHPQPADFFRTMEDVSGMDLAWFWRGWFYTNATLDQSIAGVEQVDDYDGQTDGDQPWVFVDLENHGDMVMPVWMEVTYDDGTTERHDLPVEIWYSTNKWTAGFDPGSRTVTRVVIDPQTILPDTDRGNNRWSAGGGDDAEDSGGN